jgi:hypothetical protein
MGLSAAMVDKHSRPVDGGRAFWLSERLWRLSAELPVRPIAVADIAEFDEDCWFGGTAPTCRQVAEHARRIERADLTYPVILAADGRLMDGGHRIARAWLDGRAEVLSVRFEVDPSPDYIQPDPDPGPESDPDPDPGPESEPESEPDPGPEPGPEPELTAIPGRPGTD